MRLLIDTNIILEVLLAQEKSQEAQALLSQNEQHDFFLSDYSLHSIGVVLFRKSQPLTFDNFVNDLLVNANTQVITLGTGQLNQVTQAAMQFRLDFDDAYQYALATEHQLTLVSFDSDFQKTDLSVKIPQDFIQV